MINPIEMENYLKGVDYPASRQDLIDKASQNNAPEDVIDALNTLPDDTFDSPTDVTEALSDEEENEEA